jgi:hypothetical protein
MIVNDPIKLLVAVANDKKGSKLGLSKIKKINF